MGNEEIQMMTPRQVADLLEVHVATLKKWRHAGAGPPAVKLSAHVIRYRRAEVIAFIRSEADRAEAS